MRTVRLLAASAAAICFCSLGPAHAEEATSHLIEPLSLSPVPVVFSTTGNDDNAIPSEEGQEATKERKTEGSSRAKRTGTTVARDGNGKAVDWFFIVKLPAYTIDADGAKTQAHCDCPDPSCAEGDGRGPGLCYLYADANNPKLTHFRDLGYDCLGQGGKDPVSQTLKQASSPSSSGVEWAYWNDDFSKLKNEGEGRKNCGPSSGGDISAHAKGGVLYDANGGTIFQTSTPNYPDASEEEGRKFVSLGCQQSDNTLYAQQIFAASFSFDQMKELAKAMYIPGLCSSNLYTGINPSSPNFGTLIPEFAAALTERERESVASAVVKLKTTGGEKVTAIMKNRADRTAPWSLVAHYLGSDLSVATWWSGAKGIPSICRGDNFNGVPQLNCLDFINKNGTAEYSVENVLEAQSCHTGQCYRWTMKGGTGKSPGNHAKFGIGSPGSAGFGNKELVISGDMNMEGFPCAEDCDDSQFGRGGMFFSLSSPELAASIREDLFSVVCSCSKGSVATNRMCNAGCYKKLTAESFPKPLQKVSFWTALDKDFSS